MIKMKSMMFLVLIIPAVICVYLDPELMAKGTVIVDESNMRESIDNFTRGDDIEKLYIAEYRTMMVEATDTDMRRFDYPGLQEAIKVGKASDVLIEPKMFRPDKKYILSNGNVLIFSSVYQKGNNKPMRFSSLCSADLGKMTLGGKIRTNSEGDHIFKRQVRRIFKMCEEIKFQGKSDVIAILVRDGKYVKLNNNRPRSCEKHEGETLEMQVAIDSLNKCFKEEFKIIESDEESRREAEREGEGKGFISVDQNGVEVKNPKVVRKLKYEEATTKRQEIKTTVKRTLDEGKQNRVTSMKSVLGVDFDQDSCDILEKISSLSLFSFPKECLADRSPTMGLNPEHRQCECNKLKTSDCNIIKESDSVEWGISKCEDKNKETIFQLEFKDKYRMTNDLCWPNDMDSDGLKHSVVEELDIKKYLEKANELEVGCLRICLPSPCCFANSASRSFLSVEGKRNDDPIRKISVNLCERCFCGTTVKQCKVSVKSEGNKIIIDMNQFKGRYRVYMGGEMKEGEFDGSRSIDFEVKEPGSYFAHGYCNWNHFRENIVWTVQEFCDNSYPGVMNKPGNYYCKNYKKILVLLRIEFIVLIVYLLNELTSKIAGLIVALPVLPLLYLFKKRIICKHCMSVKTFLHECYNCRCCFCNERIMGDEEYEMKSEESKRIKFRTHIRSCKVARGGSESWCMLLQITRLLRNVTGWIIKKFSVLFGLIVIIYMLGYSKAESDFLKRFNSGDEMICNGTELTMIVLYMSIAHILVCLASIMMEKMAIFIEKKMRTGGSKKKCSEYELLEASSIIKDPNEGFENKLYKSTTREYREDDQKSKIASNIRFLTVMIFSNMSKCGIMIITVSYLMNNCHALTHKEEMDQVEKDMTNYINGIPDFTKEYHPFMSRLTDQYLSNPGDMIEEKICDGDKCYLKLVIKDTFEVIRGKEFGFKYNTKENSSKSVEFHIKISESGMVCSYKDLYKTFKVEHKSVSTDTCTKGCDECLKDLSTDVGRISHETKNITHDGSSSWSCDGLGCMSIGSGCTCAKCWCERDGVDEYMIKRLLTERKRITICIGVGGDGYCKTITDKDKSGKIKAIEVSGGDIKCNEMIACKNKMCFYGQINDLEEFDEKFGTVQEVEGKGISVKFDEIYEEMCIFGQHRSMKVSKCCKDNYHLEESLHLINGTIDKQNHLITSDQNAGKWNLEIELPRVHLVKEESKIKLTKGSIMDCRGCYSCSEGGACVLSIMSDKDAHLKILCKGCNLDTSYVSIKRGMNKQPFTVYCNDKQGNLNCTIGEEIAYRVNGSFNLKDKANSPHGNWGIKIDETKIKKHECKSFLCIGNLWDLIPSFGMMGMLKVVGYCIVVAILVICLYTFISLWRAISNERRKDM